MMACGPNTLEQMKHFDLTSVPLFKGIESKQLNRLIEGGSFEAHTKGEFAFEEGAPGHRFGIVKSGLFRMTKADPSGARVSILFLSADDLLGDFPMAEAEPRYVMTCETLVSGIIFWIPRETYLKHWLTCPNIMQRMQSATLARLEWMAQCRADQRLSLECRLAGFLLRTHERFKNKSESSVLKLTRSTLSDAVGASVESVIRTMTKWEKHGLVLTEAKTIFVAQPDRLKEIYDSSQSGRMS